MGFVDNNTFSNQVVAKLVELIALLPDYSAVTVSDLPKLAEIQDFFENAADLFTQECAPAAVVTEQYKSLVENIMLGDDTSENSLPIIVKCLDRIIQLPESSNPQEIISEISNYIEQDETPTIGPPLDDETAPPMGVLMLNSQEDQLIYNEFISESNDHLDNIESEILTLEEGKAPHEVIESVFRAFHSIKGAAGFLGLTAVNKLCHECENLLDKARKGEIRVSREINDALLCTKDALGNMLDIIKTQVSENKNGMPIPEYNILSILKSLRAVSEQAVQEYNDNFQRNNEIIHSKLGGILVENGILSEKQLQQALNQQNRPLGDIVVDMGVASHDQIENVIQNSSTQLVKKTSSIKVEATKLETLLEMAGELLVAHSQVANYKELCNEKHLNFARNVANLGKISSNLQEAIMSLRLVPIKGLFNKMTRLVRDTASKTNKNAVLKLFGEDTEIDKTIIDQVADPLVHLLRNAVDHGIEDEEARLANGKDKFGVIDLKAYHSGGSVVIEITDDGNGINPEKICKKAIDKGFITENEVLTDEEKLNLIFLPGFSTNDVATDISGRGVGMDVVKKNINTLGGNVIVKSVLGKGTSFIIRLPLTMAIVDGMVIKIGDQRYVLPTLNIDESIKPKKEDITGITGKKAFALQVRGELVPLIELAWVFNQEVNKEIFQKLVVIVRNDNKRVGLIIDEVQEQQQVVIKNLGNQLKGLVGVSGGCILGDGRVGLILDIPSLIKLADHM